MKKNTKLILLIILGVHLFLLINLSFTPWPEMLSYPYLFSNGYTLYKDFIVPYPPFLIIFLSSVYGIFGYKVVTLKILNWALILGGDLLIYKITKLITKKENFSILAVLFFVFLQPFLEGNMFWFDTFLNVPILFSIYLLLQKKNISKNLILTGLFLAVAVFTKQTALIYLLVAICFVSMKYKNLKKLILLLIPSFIFGVIFLIYLISNNTFFDFLNWNLIFPFKYWGDYPTYLQLGLKKIDYLISGILILPVLILIRAKYEEVFKNKNILFLFSMFLASLLAIYPRFSYYHLSVGICLSAIFFGIFLKHFKKNIFIKTTIVLFALLFFWYQQRIVIAWDWRKPDRFFSDSDIQISKDINNIFSNDEKVYLGNIHSGVYVYSKVLPPKPWYDNFGWYLEIPGEQEKVLNRWKENPPEAIYWKKENEGQWYTPGVYQPKKIYDWIEENYIIEKEVVKDVWIWRKNK